jgi:hypothetical protein
MYNHEIGNNQKVFDLGAILNITTCRLLTNMDDIYEVLNYLTGDSIYTHQIPRVIKVARSYVLSLYPELNGIDNDVVINSFEDAKIFIDEQKQVFGEKLPLMPMSKADGYSYVDPIIEAFEMTSRRGR